eukprot:COSAG01_NODE_47307_length_391_cov_3.311644_2_plen_55_part_01
MSISQPLIESTHENPRYATGKTALQEWAHMYSICGWRLPVEPELATQDVQCLLDA